MRTNLRLTGLGLALCCCTTAPPSSGKSSGSSGSTSGDPGTGFTDSETSFDTGSNDGTASDTDTGSETAGVEAHVKWIEVAASDYKLELQPTFDPEITAYTALADGPDISVYVDVIVDADVDAVLVNDLPTELVGFRTWRSTPQTQLISPTFAIVEVQLAGAEVPSYAIDVVVPGG